MLSYINGDYTDTGAIMKSAARFSRMLIFVSYMPIGKSWKRAYTQNIYIYIPV